MTKTDICPGSQRRLEAGDRLWCLCGRVWHGSGWLYQTTGPVVDVVPLHNADGHEVDPRKVADRLNRAWLAAIRRRAHEAEKAEKEQARWDLAWPLAVAMRHTERLR